MPSYFLHSAFDSDLENVFKGGGVHGAGFDSSFCSSLSDAFFSLLNPIVEGDAKAMAIEKNNRQREKGTTILNDNHSLRQVVELDSFKSKNIFSKLPGFKINFYIIT